MRLSRCLSKCDDCGPHVDLGRVATLLTEGRAERSADMQDEDVVKSKYTFEVRGTRLKVWDDALRQPHQAQPLASRGDIPTSFDVLPLVTITHGHYNEFNENMTMM